MSGRSRFATCEASDFRVRSLSTSHQSRWPVTDRQNIADVLERVARRLDAANPGQPLRGAELAELVAIECGCARSSVLPSDHCYNRTNNGIPSDNDPMFEHVGDGERSGLYRFLGRHARYSGLQWHYPKGGARRVVGHWDNGKLQPGGG